MLGTFGWTELLMLSFYLLPFFIALVRKQPNKWAILALNLLLGWTIIGWIIALVWAFKVDETRQREPTVVVHVDASQNKVINTPQEVAREDQDDTDQQNQPSEPNTLRR